MCRSHLIGEVRGFPGEASTPPSSSPSSSSSSALAQHLRRAPARVAGSYSTDCTVDRHQSSPPPPSSSSSSITTSSTTATFFSGQLLRRGRRRGAALRPAVTAALPNRCNSCTNRRYKSCSGDRRPAVTAANTSATGGRRSDAVVGGRRAVVSGGGKQSVIYAGSAGERERERKNLILITGRIFDTDPLRA